MLDKILDSISAGEFSLKDYGGFMTVSGIDGADRWTVTLWDQEKVNLEDARVAPVYRAITTALKNHYDQNGSEN